ncbi:MAG: hypothetical protein HZC42_15905 [Candidatus Eisenbacteria bacterium]|nr:hypothetical protein [Candidatus Eisenbacteria bacterium]
MRLPTFPTIIVAAAFAAAIASGPAARAMPAALAPGAASAPRPAPAPRTAPGSRADAPARAAAPASGPVAAPLPPIVFVSRRPLPGDPGVVPGLGPGARALAPGGRLMLRDSSGAVRPLLPEGVLFDASHPSVSFDGRRVAFAGTVHPDSAWRIFLVTADGGGLAPLTRSDRGVDLSGYGEAAATLARYDDLDPCWIAERRLVFASTRYPQLAQYGGVPATNLFTCRDTGGAPQRLTGERNGAEKPALDPVSGRLLFARWWYNRFRASDREPSGITTDPARALGDSVNLWQVVSVTPGGSDLRLAAGDPRTRAGEMATAPAPLADGGLAAVYAGHLALVPGTGGTGVAVFGTGDDAGRGNLPPAVGPARRIAGPAFGERPGDPYRDARGLAAPQACAPAALPDGRLLFSHDPGARGDFGLWVANADGSGIAEVLDLPGTLELDAAPLTPRAPHLALSDSALEARLAGRRLPDLPPADTAAAGAAFTFHCLNLFAQGAVDAPLLDAPPLTDSLRMRFFAVLARPRAAGGDSAVLLREIAVSPQGEILASALPAGLPMFEQVVDRAGRVLMSAHGPAHVAGLNPSDAGERTCMGCHAGHSALPVPRDADAARWFDAAPSARVTASSAAPRTAGPRGAVDRKTRGPAAEVAWVAGGGGEQWLRLEFPRPLEVREVVLYAPRPGTHARAARVRKCEVVLSSGGAEVARRTVPDTPHVEGTHVGVGLVTADALEVRLPRAAAGAALAEVEVIARVP